MSESAFPLNPSLYAALLDAKASIVQQFKDEGADPNSEAFLARFPFVFVQELDSDNPTPDPIRERLVMAAFSEEFRPRTLETIDIFYANWSGGTPEYYFLDLIDDFLNYALPRSCGLPDEDPLFENLYRQLEADLFTDSYSLDVIALVKNAYDHGGRFHPTSGLSFSWADSHPRIVLNSSRLRNRAVSFLEIKKSARALFGGTDVSDSHSFFVLEFEEKRKKRKDGLAEAHRRSEEITKKTVLALRLVTAAPVYAEYRGFRALGHRSGGRGMVLRNYPGERIDKGFGSDAQSWGSALERLFPPLLVVPTDSIAVVYDKIDDAFRRQQQRGAPFDAVATKPAIDQLLDYFQALEAIIPIEGSYQIALYAAVLVRAAHSGLGLKAVDVFDFVKDMHKLRNEVIHGRIDNVLFGRAKTKKYKITDIGQFRQYVHELAILYLLNPDERGNYDLCNVAHRLALGDEVDLKTLYTR